MSVDPSVLANVDFLAPLRGKAIKRVAQDMSERSVAPGDDIVTQGTTGIAFFVVIDGTASVLVDDVEVRTLDAGDHFGELALVLPDVPRTATVRAVTPVKVAGLTEWNFRAFVAEHPEIHWPLLVNLARQLVDVGRPASRAG
jgi:CRP-like cAMP-binding protein